MIGRPGGLDSGAATARGFDRLGPWYDALARLFPGDAIARSQVVFLERATGCRRALVVGGGTGRFLIELLDSGFDGAVVWLDVSEGMLRRARKLLLQRRPDAVSRVEFRRCDVRGFRGGDAFDLVCTPYVLDVFPEAVLPDVMARLDRALEVGGLWLCSDFAQPAGGVVRRGAHAGLIRLLYLFFGAVCSVEPRRLPPIRSAFDSLGLELLDERRPARGLLWSAAYRKPPSLTRRGSPRRQVGGGGGCRS